MTNAPSGIPLELPLSAYRGQLGTLLEESASLAAADLADLRAMVFEGRSGRRGRPPTQSANVAVRRRADEILLLLARAARDLRPRETQQLDDFVAGRASDLEAPLPSSPIRLHRRGWPSR